MTEKIELISSAGRVLLVMADDRDSRLRDIAQQLGLTERAVQNIVNDLAEAGLVSVEKRGRRNRYRLQRRKSVSTVGERRTSLGAWLESWEIRAGDNQRPETEEWVEPGTPPEASARQPARKKEKAIIPTEDEAEESPQTQMDF